MDVTINEALITSTSSTRVREGNRLGASAIDPLA
jgi:hypothetical protein